MLVTFTSLFDIYPDKVRKGAVVGYRKADGSMLEFPCTLDTGDAVKDAKGRWTASGLGLKPAIANYSVTLNRARAKEAWIGDGFCESPKAKFPIANQTLEHVRFVDGVTEIGKRAFWGCRRLTGIAIPEGVIGIGNESFALCDNLTDITIPEGVTAIENHAFCGCRSLTSVMIPEGVTEIGSNAFCGCSGLTNITIPKTIEKIGDMAFYRCTELTSITIPKGVTVIGDWAFKVVLALPASRVRIVSRKSKSMRSTVATA